MCHDGHDDGDDDYDDDNNDGHDSDQIDSEVNGVGAVDQSDDGDEIGGSRRERARKEEEGLRRGRLRGRAANAITMSTAMITATEAGREEFFAHKLVWVLLFSLKNIYPHFECRVIPILRR